MHIRILLLSCLLYACTSSRMIQTDLYFAQVRNNAPITEAEWKDFKVNYISKVFVKGSTTHSTIGNWLDPDTGILVTEPSFVVSYIYKRSSSVSRQIDSLRSTYQKLFQQQSVLRVDKKVKARF